ncbi:hypothetical protein [Pantoea ananatis]|uniref:hypothetical protein n=1 Tax=Pantoea ananas TaxID=553 RepID=UPI003CEC12A8
MRYPLDNPILSELRKAGTPRVDPHVLAWANAIDLDSTFISALTRLETETGILRLEGLNGEQAQRLRHGYQTQELEADRQRRLPMVRSQAGAPCCTCPTDVPQPMR